MRYLYLIVFAMLLCCGMNAQSLHFTTTQYQTFLVNKDSTLTIQDTIYNAGGPNYTGTVGLMSRVNNTLVSDTAVNDTAFTNNQVTLDSAGPGVKFSIIINTPNAAFVIGPNVIVVWPVFQNGLAPGPNDTIRIPIDVTNPLGIKESPLSKAYVYQSDQQLHIQFGDIENIIQQVRIYDIEGQLMYVNTPQNSANISTASWQKGMYLCEISTMSGERRTFKVLLN